LVKCFPKVIPIKKHVNLINDQHFLWVFSTQIFEIWEFVFKPVNNTIPESYFGG